MERSSDLPTMPPPPGVLIQPWDPDGHHEAIRLLYGRAFQDDPWPADWERFDEFDPTGVFVAIAPDLIGFAICFRRRDFGYISVVAVDPSWRRIGVASALVRACADRLNALNLGLLRIDAYEDSPAAVETYRSLGFEVYERMVED
jgi:ribosomal protein S18 acetylase RimI-like enzyme